MTRENSLQPPRPGPRECRGGPASSLRLRGQSLLEYSVLVGAVTVAMIAMANYVRMAFTARTIDIEEELSGRPCDTDTKGYNLDPCPQP